MPKAIASYWEPLEDKKVRCTLCPRNCIIPNGGKGFCLVRVNEDGNLFTTVYSEITSANYDPVEKKPLYHFYPGSVIFSIGTNGCNLDCKSCQNWEIARQDTPHMRQVFTPEAAVEYAKRYGSIGIAYTYNDPIIWFEYVKDTAERMKEAGLVNVMVTNGNINIEALRELLPLMDAFNVDLKGMDRDYYLKFSSFPNPNVWQTCEEIKKAGKHLELTKLIVPGFDNFTPEYFERFGKWISENLGKDVPLHYSRFFPAYKLMDTPPTPVEVIDMAYDVTKDYLWYVYVGNVIEPERESTYCPQCGELLVKRVGYNVEVLFTKDGKCPNCGRPVDFVF
ncbi:pyruvate formate lyase activating enzyme [Balnearium lithotrophicum]|uniref:Pyruvate formate lyase activating enzyme n=1 Tax=Balnearium lithotrophicum TaxID=223788 RepID=A0A521AS62_9BACT|nr:AmmeMemoRadiSam system radical SAM enzyme [Balnearium lithotrophicum]SMO37652.1 pyruvate formate lyase activating enzyme [Balnearium lithotrophicum]